MGEPLKKFLDITNKFGFLKPNKNAVSFGPMALLLANNIKYEWQNNSVVQSDTSMFLVDGNLNTTWQEDCHMSFRQCLQLVNEELPFGLVSIFIDVPFSRSETKKRNNGLIQTKTNLYRSLHFIDPKKSQQYFYRLQRSRNIWWRKFARDPEIFKIKEVKDDKKEKIEIVGNLPWLEETVETVHCHGSEPLESYGSMFEVKVGRKRILPHVIESMVLEAPATLVFLCDAFQLLPSRSFLRFHNRITPYKAAIAIDSSDKDVEDLFKLAEFLNLSLRKAGLHTLFSVNKHSNRGIDSQFVNHDLLGIPYILVIKDDTLRNGIAGLRSRDTTLQEQVHISKIASYMKQLFNK